MDSAPKQQIVERVKQANNILVTVSNDPSVDQLASCIGLTLMLTAMGKHATAVFSGKAPSTLEFLQPEKTLEPNTDSLRDFIISLDKSKADKLRYKVEDQVVRIFITPYRTKISEADLIFSQGDFNVEVVIALGVKEREHIDSAISAHGRILHDATVISLNSGENGGVDVGSINWHDPAASSLCEMIVSVSEAFGSGLIDNQMATAFLTGIVAETERFSNAKTTPKVMTMSAQLMAAGANQQLIATKLSEEIVAPVRMAGQTQAPVDENADVIMIDHTDELNIDEQGNLAVMDKPEFEELPSEPQPEEEHKEEQPSEEQNLPPVEESEPEPEIHTEAHGALPDRLPPGDNQVPQQPMDTNSFLMPHEHKVIEPPEHEEGSKISTQRKVLDSEGDPAIQNPFTANAKPPYDGQPVSPLDPTRDSGLLEHSKPIANAPKKPEPSAPPAPVADPSLEAIEKELHQASAGSPAPVSADTAQARQALNDVLKKMPYDEAHPKPLNSLNAQPAYDQLHNPPEVAPQPENPLKMPEKAIEPLTNLPDVLGGEFSPKPSQVDKPAEPIAPENPDAVPAISVTSDGTLRVANAPQPAAQNATANDNMAPPAPPPVPPPLTPPAQ